MGKTKKRELLPDVIRGFAIFLVVLGHCIQEGSGSDFKMNTMYFYDKVYQFIYSFHMPLFMIISGYFAWDSIEKMRGSHEKWALLGKRSANLLIPVFGWTCFDYVRLLLEHGREYPAFLNAFSFIKNFTVSLLTNAWFLWAVFWCFVIVFLMHCYFKDSIILYIIGFLALFIFPDGLGLGAYKYMMPYFIAAFYYRRWQKCSLEEKRKNFTCMERIKGVNDWIKIVILGMLFAVLFVWFDENSFIYLSGYKLIGKDVMRQLGIDFYRMIIGFVGAGLFILAWKKILKCFPNYRFPILASLGENSLGIYMISGYIIVQAGNSLGGYFKPNYLINLLQAMIVTVVSYFLTVVLKRIPILKRMVGR